MTEEDDKKESSPETPKREQKRKNKKRRRKKKKKKNNQNILDQPAETSFVLVPKVAEPTPNVETMPLPQPDLLGVTGAPFMPPLPIFPFGAGLIPPFSPPVTPGMPLEIGGTTFFNQTAPAASLDPLSLLPSHDPVAIMKQVEWYFQEDNLERDIFLRQNMDERGYVPADIIASFNRLKSHGITKAEIILCCKASTVVKVKGDKIKCRKLWYTWVLPGDKVTSIVASDDEDEEVSAAPQNGSGAAPDLTQDKTNQVLTANEFFDIFRQPQMGAGSVAAGAGAGAPV